MWKATLRGLLARRLRLALTLAAVVIGVAFVSGTYVLTDTLQRVAGDLFAEASLGIDVTVRATSGAGSGLGADRPRIQEDVLGLVEQVEGVADAEGTLVGIVTLVDPDGEVVAPRAGPNLGFSWPRVDQLGPLRIRQGRRPERDGEVAVDVATAEREAVTLGEPLGVLALGPVEEFRVVGLLAYGDAESVGPSVAAFDTATAQRLFRSAGRFDAISAAAVPGVTAEDLRDRIAAVLPVGTEAVTGQVAAAENADTLQDVFGLFGNLVLVFAFVGLFVGAFLVFNTFAVLVAQRTRELGLLRVLGADPASLLRSVLAESLLVGLTGGLLGLAAGGGLAFGLLALVRRVGIGVPVATPVVQPRTIVVGLAVGVGVTLLASITPARRAARVSPIAALSDAPVGATWRTRRRDAALGVACCGVAAVLLGRSLLLDVPYPLANLGVGAVVLYVGVAWLGPFAVAPLARLLGGPLPRITGVAGVLARENALRNPRRSASTASALMIGVSLMALTSIAAASARASIGAAIADGLSADFVLSAAEFFPFSAEAAAAVAIRPEVEGVAVMRLGTARVGGSTARVAGVDPDSFSSLVDLDVTSGTMDALRAGVFVHEGTARDHGWNVGDTIDLSYARTGSQPTRVAGIFRRNQVVFANFVIPLASYEVHFGLQQDSFVFVALAEGVDPVAGRSAVEQALREFPNIEVRDREEFDGHIDDQIGRVLGLLYALLALAVVTGLLGIANTLALSALERTREIGLLRAVGMSRRQVRRMVAGEAVLLALAGAVLGVALGAFFAWCIARVLADDGVSVFAVPYGQLLAFFVFAALAGLLASLLPARRAARLDVLAAVAQE